MPTLENFTAIQAILLVSILMECFVALAWLFLAALLPPARSAAVHWAGFALCQGGAFSLYLLSGYWSQFPVHATANLLLLTSLMLQVRGLQQVAAQPPADRTFLALLLVAAMAQVIWLAPEDTRWRITTVSLLASGICAWSAFQLLRLLRPHGNRAQRLLSTLPSAPFFIGSAIFGLRALLALLQPEQLIQDNRIDQTIGISAGLAWLFLSFGMALALAGVVLYRMAIKLQQAATHDALTGLPNRRAADDFMAQEALRAQRRGSPLSALMIDIDFFKKVNDQHGHAGGDHVLQALARLLQQRARASDMVARWGGEEFLMLLPDTPAEGAKEMAEQLRRAVQNAPLRWQQQSIPITVSIGTATWTSGPFHANALIDCADSALYQAKNSGRNRVCVGAGGL